MDYHTDVLKTAFRFIDKKRERNPKNTRGIISEAAVLCGIRIVDLFRLSEERYDIDLSEDIKFINDFFGYKE